MKEILVLAFVLITNALFAQPTDRINFPKRKGFIFGLGIGAGSLSLKAIDTTNTTFSTTLPNIKLGYKFNKKVAIVALLPGSNYKYHGKDRGFEGLIIATQYWVHDTWWVSTGTGLTFDAPAFYTVKDPKTAAFYTGLPAVTFSTGYEVWRIGRFALDLQYRVFLGKSNLLDGATRVGLSNMFILGLNWY